MIDTSGTVAMVDFLSRPPDCHPIVVRSRLGADLLFSSHFKPVERRSNTVEVWP